MPSRPDRGLPAAAGEMQPAAEDFVDVVHFESEVMQIGRAVRHAQHEEIVVIGPRRPPPIGILSTDRIGVTSTAVPTKKASSAT